MREAPRREWDIPISRARDFGVETMMRMMKSELTKMYVNQCSYLLQHTNIQQCPLFAAF
jgi:hypothetical protein